MSRRAFVVWAFPLAAWQVGLALAGPILSSPTAEQVKRAQELIRQLGSDLYGERETASREVAKMGRLALGTVRDAIRQSDDPEIVRRCQWLLPVLEASDWKARAEAFLVDPNLKKEYGLPGWVEFKAFTGDTPASRRCFTSLLREQRHLAVLEGISRKPDELSQRLRDFKVILRALMISGKTKSPQSSSYPATLEDITAIVFAEAVLGGETAPSRCYEVSTNCLIRYPAFRGKLEDAHMGPVLTRLVKGWLETRGTYQLNMAIGVARDLKMPFPTRLAEKVLQTTGQDAGTLRAEAVTMLGKVGGPGQIQTLKKAWTDETPIQTINGKEIQVRDLALIMSILLAGKEPRDFGFSLQQGYDRFHYQAWSYQRTPDQQRARAFARWKELERSLAMPPGDNQHSQVPADRRTRSTDRTSAAKSEKTSPRGTKGRATTTTRQPSSRAARSFSGTPPALPLSLVTSTPMEK